MTTRATLLALPVLTALATATASANPDRAPVIGGTDVPQGKWRDTAALMFPYQDGLSADCTGVLIAPTVVLTAGHCIYDLEYGGYTPPKRVWLGTNTLADPTRGEDLPVVEGKWHAGVFDIGLVILAQPSTLPPRKLATGWVHDDILDGARVAFAGYGAIDEEAEQYVDELREAESTVTDVGCTHSVGCERGARPDGELGAGGGGIDTCPGDSGGPLYLMTSYGEFLLGITSRGYDNNLHSCSEGGIYVRADKDEVIAWIEENSGVRLPVGRGPIAERLTVAAGDHGSIAVDADDPRAGASHGWEIVGAPLHGTATIDGDGVLTYTAGDDVGTDVVTVRATDTAAPARSARGRIDVEIVDDGGCCSAGDARGRVGPALIVLAALSLLRRRRSIAA